MNNRRYATGGHVQRSSSARSTFENRDGAGGELTGKQTDHGTLPFYAYPDALSNLTA